MVPADLIARYRVHAASHPPSAIAIGGSAGSIETLGVLLPAIAPTALPILVVVHLRANEPTRLPELLGSKCRLPVRMPFDKQPCDGATVWLAPPDFHMLVERDRVFSVVIDEPAHFSRPAIDVLFESAADAFGPALVAIVLGGASQDGASGAARVRQRGGFVIVEDPATTEFTVMPTAAVERAQPQIVIDRQGIAALLAEITGGTSA